MLVPSAMGRPLKILLASSGHGSFAVDDCASAPVMAEMSIPIAMPMRGIIRKTDPLMVQPQRIVRSNRR
jgi:hypothetical protein